MIEYKVIVMMRDDILRDPNSNTFGVPVSSGTKILTFKDGVFETRDTEIADFLKTHFASRFIIKETELPEIIKPKSKVKEEKKVSPIDLREKIELINLIDIKALDASNTEELFTGLTVANNTSDKVDKVEKEVDKVDKEEKEAEKPRIKMKPAVVKSASELKVTTPRKYKKTTKKRKK